MVESIKIDLRLPPLPRENAALTVYAKYIRSLDAIEAATYDELATVFLRQQGRLAFLKGKVLLLAKASANHLGWEEIFESLGVKRSTGFAHVQIAENFNEEEVKDKGVNELREEAQRRSKCSTTGSSSSGVAEIPPEGDEDELKLYSIKKARQDLNTVKTRLANFSAGIGHTSDAINNPQGTTAQLSAFDGDFDELMNVLRQADWARCEALIQLGADFNDLLADAARARVATYAEEEDSPCSD